MRRSVFRRMLALAVLLAALCITAAAHAAVEVVFSVSPANGSGGSVTVRHTTDSRYRLYLPGAWDASALTFTMPEEAYITLSGTRIENGQTVDLTALIGQSVVLRDDRDRKAGSLFIHQGSRIASIFVTVGEKDLKVANRNKDADVTGSLVYVESDGSVSCSGAMTSFHARGNSTFSYSKKPYQFKLDKKADLSGMGAAKTWILLANWLDLSLVRNQIALDLCKAVGIPYAVDSVPVDVYLNGSYNGLYLLTEKIQIGSQRVNIRNLEELTEHVNQDVDYTKLKNFRSKTDVLQNIRGYELPRNPEDVTGGYILEMEKSFRFTEYIDNGFKTERGLCFTIKEPTLASREQVLYAGNLLNDFHNAVLADDGVSPGSGRYYADFIDMSSFARKFLVEEFTKNFDAQASSQFFYKDSDTVDPLIYAGPCWDYDLSMGNIRIKGFYNGSLSTGDYVAAEKSAVSLYYMLHKHEDFRALLQEEYARNLLPALEILLQRREAPAGSLIRPFSEYTGAIAASADMNFTRWSAKAVKGYHTGSGTSHEKSCDYLLKWMHSRLDYLNGVWLTQ